MCRRVWTQKRQADSSEHHLRSATVCSTPGISRCCVTSNQLCVVPASLSAKFLDACAGTNADPYAVFWRPGEWNKDGMLWNMSKVTWQSWQMWWDAEAGMYFPIPSWRSSYGRKSTLRRGEESLAFLHMQDLPHEILWANLQNTPKRSLFSGSRRFRCPNKAAVWISFMTWCILHLVMYNRTRS